MLRLRPYKPCDAEKAVQWLTDELSFYQWSAGKMGEYPLIPETLNKYYKGFEYSDSFWQMTAMVEDGTPVGQFIMRFVDKEKKNIRLGFIVVDPAQRGKGYGKEMVLLAMKFAFELCMADKVTLGVFLNNPGAEKCYISCGMKEDFINTETFVVQGEVWPCREMVIEKEEYLKK